MEHKICQFFIIPLLAAALSGCNSSKQEMIRLLNKKIVFDSSLKRIYNNDSSQNIDNLPFCKILAILDENECVPCFLSHYNPKEIALRAEELGNTQTLSTIFILEHSNDREVEIIAENYPKTIIYQDKNKSFRQTNNIPPNATFKYMLLDSSNRVMIVGNPYQNKKIMNLYLKAIINQSIQESQAEFKVEGHFDFSNFPFTETQKTEFTFWNSTDKKMIIDTIFTSCDCTTAFTDKSVIEPNENAEITVIFRASKPIDFTREIYLKTNGEMHVFIIHGSAQ